MPEVGHQTVGQQIGSVRAARAVGEHALECGVILGFLEDRQPHHATVEQVIHNAGFGETGRPGHGTPGRPPGMRSAQWTRSTAPLRWPDLVLKGRGCVFVACLETDKKGSVTDMRHDTIVWRSQPVRRSEPYLKGCLSFAGRGKHSGESTVAPCPAGMF